MTEINQFENTRKAYRLKWFPNVLRAVAKNEIESFGDIKEYLNAAETNDSTLANTLNTQLEYSIIDKENADSNKPSYSTKARTETHINFVEKLEKLEERGGASCPKLDPREEMYLSRAREFFMKDWAAYVVIFLHEEGNPRYTEIEESNEEMSKNGLEGALDALQEMDLVERTLYKEIPLRVEYSLTELGERYASLLEGFKYEEKRMADTPERRETKTAVSEQ